MFRYIALELCQATLSDYVQGKFDTSSIKPLDILRQAVSGLAHLHSLDIGKFLFLSIFCHLFVRMSVKLGIVHCKNKYWH